MTDVGKEYGAALFMIASEESLQSEYGEALRNVREIFSSNTEYVELLESPSIPLGERLSVIDNVFAEAIPQNALSFLKLLCEKGRIRCYDVAIKEYLDLLDDFQHTSRAKVTSAVELTAQEKSKLTQKLTSVYGGKVDIEYVIDKDIIGGLVVEIDGKIMDGSLRHRLREVKEVISI